MAFDEHVKEQALALPFGGCPLDGVATAGQPSQQQMAELARAGYRVVLDLRASEEPRGYDERAAVEDAGMRYVLLPVTAPTLGDDTFDRFRALLRGEAERPILVHCASANRVGALLLPYLLLDEGQSLDDAFTVATGVGLRSPELTQLALDYAARHGAEVR